MSEFIIKTIPAAVVRGSVVSNELNSKGVPVQWQRMPKEIKEIESYLITSKGPQEFAAVRPAVDIVASIRWLQENQSLTNVQQWLHGLFDAVNKPRIAEAGAGNLSEVGLLVDIESLILDATMTRKRGRAPRFFDSKTFAAFCGILGAHLFDALRANGHQVPDRTNKRLCDAVIGNYAHTFRLIFIGVEGRAVWPPEQGKIDKLIDIMGYLAGLTCPENPTIDMVLVAGEFTRLLELYRMNESLDEEASEY